LDKVLLGFVGDVYVNRKKPDEIFSEVRDVLRASSVMFANLEGAYTDDPQPLSQAPSVVSAPANNLDVFSRAGFTVMSMANNHILDVGHRAMLETRARLRQQGIKTCGAGDSLADARVPAVVEVNGVRIAYLAYASVFPMGYEARHDRPGLASMRAYNIWRESYPTLHQPGAYPVVTTIPDQGDLSRLSEDIRSAKALNDVVVVSFHWGDFTSRFHLTDHEIRTARHGIDCGADMIVGHHHHALRGMEWYQGKPILYGLGHFVFDVKLEFAPAEVRELLEPGSDAARYFEQAYTRGHTWAYPSWEDSRLTLIAWASVSRAGVEDISFLPCRLDSHSVVHPLDVNSPEAAAVVSYFERCNSTQGLRTRVVMNESMSVAGFKTLRMIPSGN